MDVCIGTATTVLKYSVQGQHEVVLFWLMIYLFLHCLGWFDLDIAAEFLGTDKNNEILENGKAMPKFCFC